MKGKFSFLLALALLFGFTACDNTSEDPSILPDQFSVDIPEAVSFEDASNGRINEEVQGGLIYANLGLFIHIGEESAQLVEDFIRGIRRHNIDKPMEISFPSEDDQRMKFIKVVENATTNGETWDYGLTMYDQEDEALAFQLYWNTSPIKGIAIMDVYNIDRTNHQSWQDVMYQIEYSEAETDYEKQMIVSISGLPVDGTDQFAIDNLKMWAGKNGNEIKLYGNSNHPQMQIIDENFADGRNYAFVAKTNAASKIGVAEVGLPPSNTQHNDGLLTEYSIYNVFVAEIENQYGIDIIPGGAFEDYVVNLLKNTEAPGYFIEGQGFVSCSDQIPDHVDFTTDFIDLSSLHPYIPADIKNLVVKFE